MQEVATHVHERVHIYDPHACDVHVLTSMSCLSLRFFTEIIDLPIIEPLLHIVSEGESTYRCMGAELLDILVENKECRTEIQQLR